MSIQAERLIERPRPVAHPARLRVLVAVDGSPSAEQACRRLPGFVRPDDTEVRLVTVLSYGMRADAYHQRIDQRIDADLVHEARASVEVATGPSRGLLEASGFGVQVAHRFGNPADAILEEIREWGPDLVVMGRRGLGVPARWLLGSVSDRVLRNAHVPVLIVP